MQHHHLAKEASLLIVLLTERHLLPEMLAPLQPRLSLPPHTSLDMPVHAFKNGVKHSGEAILAQRLGRTQLAARHVARVGDEPPSEEAAKLRSKNDPPWSCPVTGATMPLSKRVEHLSKLPEYRSSWEQVIARLVTNYGKEEVEQIVEQVVHIPKIIQQKRAIQQYVEQVVEVPVPMTQEEIAQIGRAHV